MFANQEDLTQTLAGQLTDSMSKAVQDRGTVRNIGVLIAEDHTLIWSGLCVLFKTQPDIQVLGVATDGESAVSLALRLRPDILLLDLSLPKKSGRQVLRELSRSNFHGKTIVLTASIDREQTVEAVQLGASGVILKDAPPPLLFKSIRNVIAGQYWLDRSSVHFGEQRHGAMRQSTIRGQQVAFRLTPRELQVISAVVDGCCNKGIAEKLSISDQTVKNHITSIFYKLGVSSRLELALFAMKHQLPIVPGEQ